MASLYKSNLTTISEVKRSSLIKFIKLPKGGVTSIVHEPNKPNYYIRDMSCAIVASSFNRQNKSLLRLEAAILEQSAQAHMISISDFSGMLNSKL